MTGKLGLCVNQCDRPNKACLSCLYGLQCAGDLARCEPEPTGVCYACNHFSLAAVNRQYYVRGRVHACMRACDCVCVAHARLHVCGLLHACMQLFRRACMPACPFMTGRPGGG